MRNLKASENLNFGRGFACGPKYKWFKAADAKVQKKAQSSGKEFPLEALRMTSS